jgi:hypothetical protein
MIDVVLGRRAGEREWHLRITERRGRDLERVQQLGGLL